MLDFLTPPELAELTGLHQTAAQARWLKARGWKFETTAHGALRVTRNQFRARMDSTDAANEHTPTQSWTVRPVKLVAVK